MKKIAVAIGLSLAITGCASNEIESVTRGAVNGILDSTGTSTKSSAMDVPTIGETTVSRGSKAGREKIRTSSPTRSSRDYGTVTVAEVVANPEGLTKIAFRNSTHLDSGGNLEGTIHYFPVSPEGFLIKDSEWLRNGWKEIANSGTYYIKAKATATKAYATGEVTLTRGKTNIIDVILE
ncbi:hypothetical protein [Motilimonas pumila]|uniref:Lipoprotein n=1 Tax=Motilimonas pumila TaxID=2303987 RepID=A0A418YDT1_9GAMM|nr:hypothetical protein [Motilimonas pumila]RJG42664.1 hypothetical protein D1Z90_12410 [Motilimonas pumila]